MHRHDILNRSHSPCSRRSSASCHACHAAAYSDGVLHGVTLPIDDTFWEQFTPPNGWNCRCSVVQVRKSKFPATPHNEAMALGEQATQRDTRHMFRFNPGKEQKTFPDYNPYTIAKCQNCDIASKLASSVSDNQLCAGCVLLQRCYEQQDEIIKHGKGEIRINRNVNRSDSDFDKLYQIAEHFASEGEVVELTPKMSRPPKFKYECIYGDLIGTKYEGKCPDLRIGGKWYEHEGFISDNPKRAFANMINHGLKQSSRIIIDRPDLTERYMSRSIFNRINNGEDIQEIWLRDTDGSLRLLYKKTGANQWLAPAVNESVVISHGIVTANIATIFQITIIWQLKKAGFLKSALSLNQC